MILKVMNTSHDNDDAVCIGTTIGLVLVMIFFMSLSISRGGFYSNPCVTNYNFELQDGYTNENIDNLASNYTLRVSNNEIKLFNDTTTTLAGVFTTHDALINTTKALFMNGFTYNIVSVEFVPDSKYQSTIFSIGKSCDVLIVHCLKSS
jgi:hypothetical protein